MRKFLFISSVGAAVAGSACRDGDTDTCTQGAALLQKRSSIGRGTNLNEDMEMYLSGQSERNMQIAQSVETAARTAALMSKSMLSQVGAATTGSATESFCISKEDETPDAPFAPQCSFKGQQPGTVECASAGCASMSNPGGSAECHCPNKAACEGLGGVFSSPTCSEAMKQCGDACKVFKEAKDKGSCDGLKFMNGPDLEVVTPSLAKLCCKSAPKNICNKDGKIDHPCAADSDFAPGAFVSGTCEFSSGFPSGETCVAAGCQMLDTGDCYCDKEASCKAAKGTYLGQTCGDTAAMWLDAAKAIRKARKAGSCEGDVLSSASLGPQLKHYAKMCCKAYPKYVCNPKGEIQNPCKDASDFDPEAELHVAGMSCGKFADFMEVDPLKKARKQGCKGVKNSWGMDVSETYGMVAKACCKSAKSVCDA